MNARVTAIAAAALAAACAPATKLTAGDVVSKNVAARGGLEAWRKVETMVWTGHIASPNSPAPSLPFELDQKRPNKTRLEVDVMGDKALRVFDGARGWKVPQSRGRMDVKPYSPQELKYAQAGHGLAGPLIDSAARGAPVTLAGLDELGDRKAYHLRVGDDDVWVDAETFLDLRYDRMADAGGASQRRVTAMYADYRTVDGLLIPFRIETGGDKMQIERVVLNAPLFDWMFENPAAPHVHNRGRPAMANGSPAR